MGWGYLGKRYGALHGVGIYLGYISIEFEWKRNVDYDASVKSVTVHKNLQTW